MASLFDVILRGLRDTKIFTTQSDFTTAVTRITTLESTRGRFAPVTLSGLSSTTIPNIPAGVKVIRVILDNIQHSASATTNINIITSSGTITSGYTGSANNFGVTNTVQGALTTTTITTSYTFNTSNMNQETTIRRISDVGWMWTGRGGFSGSADSTACSGSVSANSDITGLVISTSTGTWTSGHVSVEWEV